MKRIICTDRRGVFFGEIDQAHLDKAWAGDPFRMTDVRMCIKWHQSVGGLLGLAQSGPNDQCRISASAPAITLCGIHAVFEPTDEAVRAWQEAPACG